MKIFALLSLFLFSLSAQALSNERRDLVQLKKEFTAAAKLDIKGDENSPFGGIVKALHDKMEEDYGGRFSADSLTVTVSSLNFSFYRAPAKYCNGLADKNGNRLPDETEMESPSAIYRICDRLETFTYLVTFSFDSSTSGSVDREGVVVKMVIDDQHNLLVNKNAGYNPEPREIFKKSLSSTITTSKVEL